MRSLSSKIEIRESDAALLNRRVRVGPTSQGSEPHQEIVPKLHSRLPRTTTLIVPDIAPSIHNFF
jgi:hypothetical protein